MVLEVLVVIGKGVEAGKVFMMGLGNDGSANMDQFARLTLEYLLEQLEKNR